MNKNASHGFTLIELLVVIAIIGILSSIVLASLGTARNKGSDAAVKAALKQLISQSVLYYDGAGANSYGGTVDTGITNSCSAGFLASGQQGASIIANVNSNDSSSIATTCYIGKNVWAASAALKGGGYFCVDSNGVSTSTSALTIGTSDVSCN